MEGLSICLLTISLLFCLLAAIVFTSFCIWEIADILYLALGLVFLLLPARFSWKQYYRNSLIDSCLHRIWLNKQESVQQITILFPFFFSCPGSSIPDLGQWVSEWLGATLEFWHKDRLLRLETLPTFDQHDVQTKSQKRQKKQQQKKTKNTKDKKN